MVSFARWRRNPATSINDFWAWWPTVSDVVAKSLEDVAEQDAEEPIDAGDTTRRGRRALPSKLVRSLTAKVEAIHPELSWELLDGLLARHALVLTAEGSPELRPLTERWRRAGPGDDEFWEYYPARPPNPGALRRELRWGRRLVSPQQARFGAEFDHDHGRVHVVVSHPQLPYLEDAARLRFAFLLLDWLLGEDDVERWIGEVRFSESTQELDGPGLRDAVSRLAGEFSGVQWMHLEGVDGQGRRATLQVRIPLPRLDFPLFDLLGTIEFPYENAPAGGDDSDPFAPVEPDTGELIELERLTKALISLLGDSAVLAASAILPDRMTLHFYASTQSVVPDQVAAWTKQQKRDIRVSWTADPGWDTVRHFV